MDSHELNSIMLYIHPPLAIIGYVLIFLFAILIIQKKYSEKRITKLTGFGLLVIHFFGLIDRNALGSISLGKLLVLGPKGNNDTDIISNCFRWASCLLWKEIQHYKMVSIAHLRANNFNRVKQLHYCGASLIWLNEPFFPFLVWKLLFFLWTA